MNRITVGIAELKAASGNDVLITLGLGSCVVTALYDEDLGLGSLAHIMLPRQAFGRRRSDENMLKYADVALPAAISLLEEAGSGRERLRAKIAGGAHMFDLAKEKLIDIGERNVEAVTAILAELEIPLVASDTGGNRGRSVEFRVKTGELSVRTIRGGIRTI